MWKTSIAALVLVSVNFLAGCTPVWQGYGMPRVRNLAAAELGCPKDSLELNPVDPKDSYSPISAKGCGKDATYIFAMGAGYVMSSVRNGSDVAMRKPAQPVLGDDALERLDQCRERVRGAQIGFGAEIIVARQRCAPA